MSKERFCPECGQPLEADERFCQDCGAEVPFESNTDTNNAEAILNKVKPSATDEPIIGAGARANVTGGTPTSTHQASIILPRSITTRRSSWEKREANIAKYAEILSMRDTPGVPSVGKKSVLIVK